MQELARFLKASKMVIYYKSPNYFFVRGHCYIFYYVCVVSESIPHGRARIPGKQPLCVSVWIKGVSTGQCSRTATGACCARSPTSKATCSQGELALQTKQPGDGEGTAPLAPPASRARAVEA